MNGHAVATTSPLLQPSWPPPKVLAVARLYRLRMPPLQVRSGGTQRYRQNHAAAPPGATCHQGYPGELPDPSRGTGGGWARATPVCAMLALSCHAILLPLALTPFLPLSSLISSNVLPPFLPGSVLPPTYASFPPFPPSYLLPAYCRLWATTRLPSMLCWSVTQSGCPCWQRSRS